MMIKTNPNQFPAEDREILLELIDYLSKNPSIFIDPQKILRHRGLSSKKILSLFDFLEKEKIGKKIYPFQSSNMAVKLIPHFKFYFFDHSLFKDQSSLFRPDQKGALLEQDFFSRIYEDNLLINTFRTTDSIEVDFIIQKIDSDVLWAFEIKKDQFIYAADLAGLHYFDKNFSGEKSLIVAHCGSRNNFEGKIHVMPIDEAIKAFQQVT